MNKIVVFASGDGSNFENIVMKQEQYNYKVEALICDQRNSGVIERARKLGIAAHVIPKNQNESREKHESAILDVLAEYNPRYLILAGYMRMIGNGLLKAYPNKIINIHPSLLPSFPGLDAVGQALNHKVRVTGVSIHYVDHTMDGGLIIAQVPISLPKVVARSWVEKEIKHLEHELYPRVIHQLCEKEEYNE